MVVRRWSAGRPGTAGPARRTYSSASRKPNGSGPGVPKTSATASAATRALDAHHAMIGRHSRVRVVRNVPDRPSTRNAPGTGELSTASTVSSTVPVRFRRCSASRAPSANAAPSRNGTRPLQRFAAVTTASTHAAASGRRVCAHRQRAQRRHRHRRHGHDQLAPQRRAERRGQHRVVARGGAAAEPAEPVGQADAVADRRGPGPGRPQVVDVRPEQEEGHGVGRHHQGRCSRRQPLPHARRGGRGGTGRGPRSRGRGRVGDRGGHRRNRPTTRRRRPVLGRAALSCKNAAAPASPHPRRGRVAR